MTIQLPIELHEAIIDLCSDKQTLFSCSLVCRAWLPPTSPRLFRCLRFVHSVGLAASSKNPGTYADLLLLVQLSWRVREHIRELYLHQSPLGAELSFSVLRQILSTLSQLRILSLDGVELKYDHVGLPGSGPRFELDQLVFSSALLSRPPDLSPILGFLSLFSLVKDLQILRPDELHWLKLPLPLTGTGQLQVYSLTFKECRWCTRDLLVTIPSLLDLRFLSSLSLDSMGSPRLDTFIDNASESFEELTYQFGNSPLKIEHDGMVSILLASA